MRGATPDGECWHPTPRFVVLAVTFQLLRGNLGAPVAYDGVARALGVAVGERARARDVREAVLDLRRSKGMVLDPHDPDTWSAGSFFVNPVIAAEVAASLPDDAPRHPAAQGSADGSVKTSAAWLIERAGFGRGFRISPDARAAVSGKHTLALTNAGGATAADILALARHIRAGVRETFGVTLEPEPVLVGLTL
jgi:UDP-N-acetylmuramate dehydrogenase